MLKGEERTRSIRDMLEEVISECTTAWKTRGHGKATQDPHAKGACTGNRVLNRRSKKTENPFNVFFSSFC